MATLRLSSCALRVTPLTNPSTAIASPALCRVCEGAIPPRRALLGYAHCLGCGDRLARSTVRTVAPMAKSNYFLVTQPSQLRELNPKRLGDNT